MSRSRSRIEKLIKRQRVRNRQGRLGLGRTFRGFLLRTVKIFFLLVLIAGGGLVGFRLYQFAFLSDYFELKKLAIDGASGALASELQALAQLKPNSGINLLLLRCERVRETILRHPRIKSAKVVKCYPNALVIQVEKREPAAIVAAGALYLIDREGYVLDTLQKAERNRRDLCFITGVKPDQIAFGQVIPSKAVRDAMDVYECLCQTNSSLADKVSEIRIGNRDELTIVLKGGVEVRLGSENFGERLAALELLARRLRVLDGLEYIDLRFENQIVYRPRSG